MAKQDVILTDLETGVWHDKFRLSADDGPCLKGSADWQITKRTLRGGVSDGVDVVSIDNGVLSVEVLPTRGMGLWRGMHRGTPLGWSSPTRFPVHPAFVNRVDQRGLGWLTGFNEWMCRCGLSSLGDPCLDVVELPSGARRESQVTLHGRIANTPCHRVSIGVTDEGPGTLMVRGVMDEAWLYGPKLRLVSTLTMTAGSSALSIKDEVTNLGDEPGELQLMYHTNLGRPLLEQGARLVVAAQDVAPYDEISARAIGSWATFDAPTPGYEQCCYFMQPKAGQDGRTAVLFTNRAREKGVGLKFSTRELPCFTLWKNLQGEGDGYLVGLEPGTCFPNEISFERDRQRVVALPPGGSYRACLEIEIYDGEQAVSAAEQAVQQLIEREPTLHPDIHPQYAPVGGMKA
jgi:hypothetical protein